MRGTEEQGRRDAATKVDPDPGEGVFSFFSFEAPAAATLHTFFISLFLFFSFLVFPLTGRTRKQAREPGKVPGRKVFGRECRTREGASTNQSLSSLFFFARLFFFSLQGEEEEEPETGN